MPEFTNEAEAQFVPGAILARHDEIVAELERGLEGLGVIFPTNPKGETKIVAAGRRTSSTQSSYWPRPGHR